MDKARQGPAAVMSWVERATGRTVTVRPVSHAQTKMPKFENFVRTKMGGFGKFWGQTFIGIIPGPVGRCFLNCPSREWMLMVMIDARTGT
jgi:hypothetical protein